MITREQYFGAKPHTPEHEAAADDVLVRREALRQEYYASTGCGPDVDPDTGTEISGKKNGSGDGGFRLKGSATSIDPVTGRERLTSHAEAKAVDDSDQGDAFDKWLDQFEVPMPNGKPGGNSKLEEYGLYREHPSATPTWCHLTTRPPGSGKRTFMP